MQPSEFDAMDYEEAADLVERVSVFHNEDLEILGKLVTEHAKATIRAAGGRIVG